MKFAVLFNFNGQYTSSRYWAKGYLTVNTSSNNYYFQITDQDPMLKIAVPLQKKLEEGVEETISNYLDDNNENNNNSSNKESYEGDNNYNDIQDSLK